MDPWWYFFITPVVLLALQLVVLLLYVGLRGLVLRLFKQYISGYEYKNLHDHKMYEEQRKSRMQAHHQRMLEEQE